MYPIEKYRFYQNNNKIIAVSTYAGKTVRGVAICHPGDNFDIEKGKELAAARCGLKIAHKRLSRAGKKVDEAYDMMDEATIYLNKMVEYRGDAYAELCAAEGRIDELLRNF